MKTLLSRLELERRPRTLVMATHFEDVRQPSVVWCLCKLSHEIVATDGLVKDQGDRDSI